MARRIALGVLLTVFINTGGPAARLSGEPAGVTLHLVALDGRGQSIRNLSAADIQIIEKGQARKISSLTFRSAASRHIALFLDDYHVSPGENSERARAAARAFADAHVRPSDTLFLM